MTPVLALFTPKGQHNYGLIISILIGAVAGGTSILWAALGETISERAGVINVGTEGCMLVGCLAAFATAVKTGNPWYGVVTGAAAGAALAAVHAWMVVYRKANQLATGLVVFFLAIGITDLYGTSYVSSEVHGFKNLAIPGLSKIPWIGPILFNHDPLVYLAYVATPAIWWFLFRSRWGLLIRTAGEKPESLVAYGLSPAKIRTLSVIAGGALAGVGGAQLSTAVALSWAENMTVGRGFIAVALVIFAAWEPMKVMAGAFLFGAAITLGSQLQVHGYKVNQFLLDALPYLVTIIVLVALARKRKNAAPEALGMSL
ncbi:MAG TPA: ABC transporter permease [Acidimicrobiales bacterium]|jgi:simple sugar transport system permease protein|nr:ABC transporter permease [Acidimicrobiales bacterium]